MFKLKELLVPVFQAAGFDVGCTTTTNASDIGCTATTCTCTATSWGKHEAVSVDEDELKILEATLDKQYAF